MNDFKKSLKVDKKNQENNKNIITIDALQEKLLNMIRSINNK